MNQITYNFTNNEAFSEKLEQNLDKYGDSISVQGTIVLEGDNHSSLVLNINHLASHTTSYIKIRAILKDNAHLNISGDIYIDHRADNCDANFDVKILHLGQKCKSEILPELRIDNRKVKSAKHAVLIKKVDQNMLYFLASRGISAPIGQNLLIEGFLNS